MPGNSHFLFLVADIGDDGSLVSVHHTRLPTSFPPFIGYSLKSWLAGPSAMQQPRRESRNIIYGFFKCPSEIPRQGQWFGSVLLWMEGVHNYREWQVHTSVYTSALTGTYNYLLTTNKIKKKKNLVYPLSCYGKAQGWVLTEMKGMGRSHLGSSAGRLGEQGSRWPKWNI